MEIRIIKSPSPGTIDILMRRKGSAKTQTPDCIDAIGLVQGRMIEMVVAADVAEKAVGVTVEDIRGSCPQNMILLAILEIRLPLSRRFGKSGKKLKKG